MVRLLLLSACIAGLSACASSPPQKAPDSPLQILADKVSVPEQPYIGLVYFGRWTRVDANDVEAETFELFVEPETWRRGIFRKTVPGGQRTEWAATDSCFGARNALTRFVMLVVMHRPPVPSGSPAPVKTLKAKCNERPVRSPLCDFEEKQQEDLQSCWSMRAPDYTLKPAQAATKEAF